LPRDELFEHRRYVAVASHPLQEGSKVVISSEFRPPSRPFRDGVTFRTKVEGILVRPIINEMSAKDIARLRKINKPAGHRVVPRYDGTNMGGPFAGAFITRPVSAAQEKIIRKALYNNDARKRQ